MQKQQYELPFKLNGATPYQPPIRKWETKIDLEHLMLEIAEAFAHKRDSFSLLDVQQYLRKPDGRMPCKVTVRTILRSMVKERLIEQAGARKLLRLYRVVRNDTTTEEDTHALTPAAKPAQLSEAEFVLRAIERLRNPNWKSRGIHTVFSGFNESFRKYYGKDPVEAVRALEEQKLIVTRFVRGGAMIYKTNEAPKDVLKLREKPDALDRILRD